MSPADGSDPPAGEEIHLPGPSLQPLGLAVGITLSIVGLTIGIVLTIAGLILSVWIIVRWIAATRRDIGELPEDHGAH